MRLGIDFDNTIVCYDALFHRVAREQGVIPADLPANKSEVRNHLRTVGREDVWTAMQGLVYGARMSEADPYPGVLDFLHACRRAAIPVFVVSHKTRHPFLGEPYDLHAAALAWLQNHGFFDPDRLGLPRDHVFFELTKQAKLERIAACRCTHFIDDLPEFLAEPGFPPHVDRLLFDPNRLYPGEARFRLLHAWPDAPSTLPLPTPSAPSVPSPPPDPTPFLAAHGVPPDAPLTPLPGGANNRVYRLRTPARDLVLKRYFHAPADPRDRFGAERALYTWAWNRGLRRTPEPIAWDPDRRLGLFEWIDGRKLAPAEPGPEHLAQAIAFVAELNSDRHLPAAAGLPVASEACFALREHLDRIEGRIDRLRRLEPTTNLEREAADFVARQLAPRWQIIRDRAAPAGTPDAILPPARRCLSPSDFGFHNALLTPDGRLRFLDFEYAGWDDPAKLVCDFFCQPQIPVDLRHWSTVVRAWDTALDWAGALEQRAARLLPAYQLKWCCILLNEFLRTDRARREFARGTAPGSETGPGDAEARQRAQLEKARHLLATLPDR